MSNITATETSANIVADETLAAAVPAPTTPIMPQRWWYYSIFAFSGFAALIYESLWARYLKIFLGHAAYAQALVLIIFLFGIAAGSAISARHSRRISSPLICYAAVEALLALIAVYFHDIFIVAQAWALNDVLPHLQSDVVAQMFKWGLGASLILVQAILLGTTFPLLAAGIVRRWPQDLGKTVAALYFVNSAGAAIGVLVGGFLLIPTIGLIGTGLFGGLINAVIAVFVWALSRRFGEADNIPPPSSSFVVAPVGVASILIITAAVTGMSSFMYEIVWTRLIALLLGASVYSFEIMLAVFIAGLAAGSFIIRYRVDRTAAPVILLAKVQIAMGVMAIISLLLYPQAFKLYAHYWGEFPRDEWIYLRHWLFGGTLAAALILPTAICAGMTLPLITRQMMQTHGESSLGIVYAANTIGSILGVYIAVYWLISATGVKNTLIIGALCDLLLGCGLFIYARRQLSATVGTALSVVVTAAALIFGGIPLHYAAAGIYRQGQVLGDNFNIIFYRDGKTASVSVLKNKVNDSVYNLSIRTNGKSDAALRYGDDKYSGDEMTMTMAGVLSLLARPDARWAANIGFGSGLTSRTLLQSPNLQRLDNIEIEPMMVAGARQLGDKIAPVFTDARNHFIFDDAKTVFARADRQYDIIISEPSNPWISGIGGLFTHEFYQQVQSSLADDGVFIQWLPFYESSPQLFASIAGALSTEFGDFRIYLSNAADAIIIAAKHTVPAFKNDIFNTVAHDFLARYDYHTVDDMETLFIGDKEHLVPYWQSFSAPGNSDYFPFVEHEAPQAFFQKTFYSWPHTQTLPVPFMEMTGARRAPIATVGADMQQSSLSKRAADVQRQFAALDDEDGVLRAKINALQAACAVNDDAENNDIYAEQTEEYMVSLSDFISSLMPHAAAAQMATVWEMLLESPCIAAQIAPEHDTVAAEYTRFWRALSVRDAQSLAIAADNLSAYIDTQAISGQIVLLASMSAHYKLGNYSRVIALINLIPPAYPAVHHAARFIGALAAKNI